MNKIPYRILWGLVDFPNELQCFNQLVNGSVGISSIKSTWCYTIFRSIEGHDLEDHICDLQIHEEKNKRKRVLKGRDNNWLMVFHLQRLHSKNEWLLITLKWPVFGDPIVKVFPSVVSPQRFMSTWFFPQNLLPSPPKLPQTSSNFHHFCWGKKNWLVVSTHLKNISQNGESSPNRGENKKSLWNHHLENNCEIQVSAKGLLILSSFKTSYDGHGCGSRLRKFNSKPHTVRLHGGSCCWETQPEMPAVWNAPVEIW